MITKVIDTLIQTKGEDFQDLIYEISDLIVKNAKNGKTFLDLTSAFDFEKEDEDMRIIKSYFKNKGFNVHYHNHSNKEYNDFSIDWLL